MVGTKKVFIAYFVSFGNKVKVIFNIFVLDYNSYEYD